jgi:pyruvate dehydrogenase E1 component
MYFDEFKHQLPDIDERETAEWLESRSCSSAPASCTSAYINTIPPEQEPWFPGDEDIERRIRAFIRWNAVAMVDRANHRFDGLGGHLSTYASAAALYEVGFNHFFRGKDDGGFGDQVYFQGHAAPGIYARAFLEGRLTEDQLDHFRRETAARACRRTRTRG